MRFNAYFKAATLLLVLSAFLSLVLTGELEQPYIIIIILGMAGGMFQERVDLSPLSRGISVFSIPFLAADFFLVSKDILYAFTHLLLLLTVARLLSLRENRDYTQIYLLSFFNLLASSALTINLSFAFTFTLYLVSATWALLLFHMKREAEGMGDVERRRLEGIVTIPSLLGTGGVAIASLFITLAIFFVLPRAGVGLFSKRPGKVLKTTGFSDKVDFGKIGPVTPDPTIVMRVELPDIEKGMGTVYLRGAVMDHFNGIAWERERAGLTPVERFGAEFHIYRSTTGLLRQEIILDPLDSRVIFGIPRVARLSGRFQALLTDASGSIYLTSSPTSRFQYTAYSDISRPAATELEKDRGPYPEDVLGLYTGTPVLSKRVRDLALSVAGKEEGGYRKAEAIERYLKRNYSYTLKPDRDESLPPVEDFLFRGRKGYCDHFSTAMTVLLREAGVPARLVTGYLTSEWNDLGRFYTVRQRNAHSWVEVYFPTRGWVMFDPTPAAPPEAENILALRLNRYISYIRHRWDRYIINFTVQDQVTAAKEARRRVDIGREAVSRVMLRMKGWIREAWVPFVFAAAILITYLLLRRKRRRGRVSAKGKTLPFYQEMLWILERRGVSRPDSLTPREFAKHIMMEKGEVYRGVSYVTSLFERARYGGIPPLPEEVEMVREIIKRIKKIR